MGIPPRSEKIQPVSLEEAFQNRKWVEAEFGNVDFGYKDTKQRLIRIAGAKAQNPSAPYMECFAGNRHELKAYVGSGDSMTSDWDLCCQLRNRSISLLLTDSWGTRRG